MRPRPELNEASISESRRDLSGTGTPGASERSYAATLSMLNIIKSRRSGNLLLLLYVAISQERSNFRDKHL